eukprot:1158469-Pelagomonas_calceolata.AAC.7
MGAMEEDERQALRPHSSAACIEPRATGVFLCLCMSMCAPTRSCVKEKRALKDAVKRTHSEMLIPRWALKKRSSRLKEHLFGHNVEFGHTVEFSTIRAHAPALGHHRNEAALGTYC